MGRRKAAAEPKPALKPDDSPGTRPAGSTPGQKSRPAITTPAARRRAVSKERKQTPTKRSTPRRQHTTRRASRTNNGPSGWESFLSFLQDVLKSEARTKRLRSLLIPLALIFCATAGMVGVVVLAIYLRDPRVGATLTGLAAIVIGTPFAVRRFRRRNGQ